MKYISFCERIDNPKRRYHKRGKRSRD